MFHFSCWRVRRERTKVGAWHDGRVKPRLADQRSPAGGIVRAARRPAGWIAPGPRPPEDPARERPELWPGPDEDLCWLCGDFRILQRTDGHRFSLDDLATAFVAADALKAPPARVLDLGCGIGTVLLCLSWRFPDAQLAGVEAQEVSAGLALRSLAWNGVETRVALRRGDLRDPAVLPEGRFDLVTGTPPYFVAGQGTKSDRVQRGPARFEERGGVEGYTAAAARALAPGGRFVVCHAAPALSRTRGAIATEGMHVASVLEVVPREGRAPLVVVITAGWPGDVAGEAPPATLVVRDGAGAWTPDFRALRRAMGQPDAPPAG